MRNPLRRTWRIRQVRRALAAGAAALALSTVGTLWASEAKADLAFWTCPSGWTAVVAGTPTSCPFADNVRNTWYASHSNPIMVYSPVTIKNYWMYCQPAVNTVNGWSRVGTLCVGGDNNSAMVVLL